MIETYIIEIGKFASFTPRVSLEIGAYDGEYSGEVMNAFRIPAESVWLVEPNAQRHEELAKKFPKAHRIQKAVAGDEGNRTFRTVTNPERNKQQCSSLVERVDDWNSQLSYESVEVLTITGSRLLDEIAGPVDLCIVDVEGMTLEVLHSFGSQIGSIRSFMLECEHAPIFRGRHLFDETSAYLVANGFRMVAFQYSYPHQSDSVWIQEKYLNLSRMRPLPAYYGIDGAPHPRIPPPKSSDT